MSAQAIRDALQRAMADARRDLSGDGGEFVQPDEGRDGREWKTFVSKLRDDLAQGRGTIPPEQYRQAIESYFRAISESVPELPITGQE